ncbi:hypothetical protein EDB84DRAFT_1434049 [Lactarius hengduanensis]|nr:hypothetical protein EDB84DRAFT_1434049 [Lactarius hengduanensis]
MARTKQACRPQPSRPRPRPQLATMSCGGGYQSPAKPAPQKVVDFSAEIRDLERDTVLHPHPESTRSRQEPAMTRYHGVQPRAPPAPKQKKRAPRSRRKKVKASAQTVAEALPLTRPETPPLTRSEAPASQRRSEVTLPPVVIDLTEDD